MTDIDFDEIWGKAERLLRERDAATTSPRSSIETKRDRSGSISVKFDGRDLTTDEIICAIGIPLIAVRDGTKKIPEGWVLEPFRRVYVPAQLVTR
jgi:hypothetical protein